MMFCPPNTAVWLRGAAIALLMPVVFLHLWRIGAVPAGFAKDESAIALNAAWIAAEGRDEHGVGWPTYFRSFDDYKAPVYIYTLALAFKLGGVSELLPRLTSAGWFLVSLGAILLLVRSVFPGRPVLLLYTVVGYGLLPGVFVISRLGFEVISQVALFSLSLVAVWYTFGTFRQRVWIAVACGLVFGLCLYAYPTSRLLVPCWILVLWLLYAKRGNLARLAVVTLAFLASIVPHLVYSAAHPGAMTARFRRISYLFSSDLSLADTVQTFFFNYIAHFSPGFLALHGDANLRHGTGQVGIVYIVVLVLAVAGILTWAVRRAWRHDTFFSYILCTLSVVPLAASLTSDVPHALRAALMGPSIFVLSCYGLDRLLEIRSAIARTAALAILLSVLAVEAAAFQSDYFQAYPRRSAEAMGSYGFADRLRQAMDEQPESICYVASDISYAHVDFFLLAHPNASDLPVLRLDSIDDLPVGRNYCLLYRSPQIGDRVDGARLGAPGTLIFGDNIQGAVKLIRR